MFNTCRKSTVLKVLRFLIDDTEQIRFFEQLPSKIMRFLIL